MKIKGKEDFLRQLKIMPEILREEIHKALRVSAEEMEDLAKRFAPVDSGALRASIGYTFGNYRPDNANVRGVSSSGSAARSAKSETGLLVAVHAGDAKAWYASLVENGTSPHTIEPREAGGTLQFNGTEATIVHHPGASARPFFWPAYRLTRKRAKARLSRAIRNGMRKAVQS